MISAQTRSAFVARENRFTPRIKCGAGFFRIMPSSIPKKSRPAVSPPPGIFMSQDFGGAGRLRELTTASGVGTRVQSLPEQKKRPIAQASTRKVSGCVKVIFA